MNLSEAYANRNEHSFLVVAYEDGHGTIELVDKTFTNQYLAQRYIDENVQDFTNLTIYKAKLTAHMKPAMFVPLDT